MQEAAGTQETGARARALLWDYLREFVRENPGLAAVSLATLLVLPVQDVLLPHVTGTMVNAVRDGAAPLLRPFLVVLAVVAGLELAYAGIDVVEGVLFPRLHSFLRQRMVGAILAAQAGALGEDLHTGELLARFAKVPEAMSFWFETVKSLLPHLLVYAAATGYFLAQDAVLGAAVGAAVGGTVLAIASGLAGCGERAEARAGTVNAVIEAVDEALRNSTSVVASGGLPAELARLGALERQYGARHLSTVLCAMRPRVWMTPLAVGLVALVLLRSRARVLGGAMSTGRFVSMFLIVLYLMNSFLRMVGYVKSMTYHWGVVRASVEALAQPPAPPPARGPRVPRDVLARPGFGVYRASYVPPGAPAATLVDATVHVAPGERVAVVGDVGSGKSTLLRVLSGLTRPHAGAAYFGGAPHAALPGGRPPPGALAYVPQSPVLFDRSVLDNVLYGHAAAHLTERDVLALAASIGADRVLAGLERGLHTRAGKAGSRLSGGQRQVVLLLRALIGRPAALLLDEPTSALDPGNVDILLAAVAQARAAVVVTHDMALARRLATRVVVVRAGRVAAPA
jgi:ATP-binding cassette subfamily B protein